jgi:beta-lysine 5,6-aminomutase beta subunit
MSQKVKEKSGKVKMYGDQMGDGAIQLSFTLPARASDELRVAAVQLCEKMGLKNPKVIHMEEMDIDFTFFVVYATSDFEVDLSTIQVPKLENPVYGYDRINDILKRRVKRKAVVLGACIGTDAHTVGIDAIFNMKGYLGDYGLERYPMLNAINLRAQVDVKDLVKEVVARKADAVLVSRVVTQRDSHIVEMRKFLDELKRTDGVPEHLITICGGPRITHKEAAEIGYDAGFGAGTKPSEVASFIADELVKRLANKK